MPLLRNHRNAFTRCIVHKTPKTRNYTKSHPQKDRYSEEDNQMPQGKENMHTRYMHKEHTVCMHVCIDRHRYMNTTDRSSG